MSGTTKPKPRVVCAAIMNKEGAIVIGVRHFDYIMHATLDLRKELFPTEDWHDCDQGFVDQYSVFISRTEAWKIAVGINAPQDPTKNADIRKARIKNHCEHIVGGDFSLSYGRNAKRLATSQAHQGSRAVLPLLPSWAIVIKWHL